MAIAPIRFGAGKLWQRQINQSLQSLSEGGFGSPSWDAVTGKPSTFPPASHSHIIGDVTGLQAELDGKSANGHGHAISDVTGLQTALDGKQAAGSYAAAIHGHAIADTSGLQAALDGKSATGHTHTASGITDFAEAVDDRVATLLTAGSNITLTYNDAAGTLTVAASGGGADPWSYVTLASDNTVSTTTVADVTGMSFTATANTAYEVEIFGAFQTAATTTGIGVAFNIPSGTVSGMCFAPSANTTAMVTLTRADDAVIAPTTAVATANTDFPIFGKYLISVGASGGMVQLRQRSEIAGSNSVLKAGLRMKYRAV